MSLAQWHKLNVLGSSLLGNEVLRLIGFLCATSATPPTARQRSERAKEQ